MVNDLAAFLGVEPVLRASEPAFLAIRRALDAVAGTVLVALGLRLATERR